MWYYGIAGQKCIPLKKNCEARAMYTHIVGNVGEAKSKFFLRYTALVGTATGQYKGGRILEDNA